MRLCERIMLDNAMKPRIESKKSQKKQTLNMIFPISSTSSLHSPFFLNCIAQCFAQPSQSRELDSLPIHTGHLHMQEHFCSQVIGLQASINCICKKMTTNVNLIPHIAVLKCCYDLLIMIYDLQQKYDQFHKLLRYKNKQFEE